MKLYLTLEPFYVENPRVIVGGVTSWGPRRETLFGGGWDRTGNARVTPLPLH